MRALSIVPIVAAVALAGCAHAPLTGPADGGGAWSALTSTHFALSTDLPPREAEAALREFEQAYGAFERLLFPSPDPSRERIDLVLFSREEDFRAVAPEGAAGYFMPHQNDEVEHTPTIAMFGRLQASMRRRFQHELTHRFLEQRIRTAPPWLEEGMAEFYSTMRLAGEEAILGELPLQRLFTTEIHTVVGLTERWVEQRVSFDDLPSVRELLTDDARAFHAPDRELANYAASWALVHLLQNGPRDRRAQLGAYLDALAAGEPAAAAWRRSFGDRATAALDAELKRHLIGDRPLARRSPYLVEEAPIAGGARPLTDGEVHLLWARIRPWDERSNIYRAGEDLARAPISVEGHYWRALYQERWRRFDDAEASLQSALHLAPDEPRLWHALAQLRWNRALDRPSDARWLPRAGEAVARLAPIARSASSLSFVARFLSERGDPEAALPFARRAVETAPSCWECRDTFAAIRRATGNPIPPPPPARDSLLLDDLISFRIDLNDR